MNSKKNPTVPVWYWVVAILALLWNLMGCAMFLMELFAQEAMMETMTEAQREWARSIPSWVYFVYGLAVFSGVAGCIGLLMRKGWSVWPLAICLASVIVQMGYTMFVEEGLEVMGPTGLIMPAVVITISAAVLWFSWFANGKGWFGAEHQANT